MQGRESRSDKVLPLAVRCSVGNPLRSLTILNRSRRRFAQSGHVPRNKCNRVQHEIEKRCRVFGSVASSAQFPLRAHTVHQNAHRCPVRLRHNQSASEPGLPTRGRPFIGVYRRSSAANVVSSTKRIPVSATEIYRPPINADARRFLELPVAMETQNPCGPQRS